MSSENSVVGHFPKGGQQSPGWAPLTLFLDHGAPGTAHPSPCRGREEHAEPLPEVRDPLCLEVGASRPRQPHLKALGLQGGWSPLETQHGF